MAITVIAEWEGREREHKPKSADWYWVLGILAVASAVAAVLFGNALLALLVIIAASVIALYVTKEPPLHRFRVVEEGLMIGEHTYPFSEMSSFSVLEDIEGELPPLLSIKNDSWHSPHLVIPLADVDADLVYAEFLKRVDEQAHRHSFVDVVAAWLGF